MPSFLPMQTGEKSLFKLGRDDGAPERILLLSSNADFYSEIQEDSNCYRQFSMTRKGIKIVMS